MKQEEEEEHEYPALPAQSQQVNDQTMAEEYII